MKTTIAFILLISLVFSCTEKLKDHAVLNIVRLTVLEKNLLFEHKFIFRELPVEFTFCTDLRQDDKPTIMSSTQNERRILLRNFTIPEDSLEKLNQLVYCEKYHFPNSETVYTIVFNIGDKPGFANVIVYAYLITIRNNALLDYQLILKHSLIVEKDTNRVNISSRIDSMGNIDIIHRFGEKITKQEHFSVNEGRFVLVQNGEVL